jgi:hypothetical protein
MDYAGMAQRLGQFRQAQVPGGGQRPMNGWGGPRGQGMDIHPMGDMRQAMQQRIQGMMPQGMQMPHNPMGQPSQVPMGQGVMGAFKRFGQ